ncbi:MAG: helix-turn-helix domain-containing protein [Ruminococcaceae bacterium]|nr:helix-turn-helix domain-containing protein [Oscillospiraceae bacterium]
MKSSIPMTFGEKTQSDFSFTRIAGEKAYSCREHWHDCFEIISVKEGNFIIHLDGEKYILSCGDIAIIPPRVLHSTASDESYREVYIFGYTENLIYSPDISIFNMKYLAPFRYGGKARHRVLHSEDGNTDKLCRLLEEVSIAYEREDFGRELSIRSKILDIHALICAFYLDSKVSSPLVSGYLTKAQIYIELHIEEDISPYDIADAIHTSYSHLARLTHNAYGFSLSELILRMKLNYAERLMTDSPEASITYVSQRSGFGSASYFTRCFRRVRGITPRAFRTMMNNTNLPSALE